MNLGLIDTLANLNFSSLTDSLKGSTETEQQNISGGIDLFCGFVSCDTIFATGITLGVFGLGFLIDFISKRKNAKEQAKSIREAFHYWVVVHKTIFMAQKVSIDEFIANLSNSTDIHEERLIVKSVQLQKLEDLPFLQLMNTFVTNSKGVKEENEKAFFNMISSLGFLISFNQRLFEKYTEFSNGTEKIREEWNTFFQEYDELNVSASIKYISSENSEGNRIFRELSAFSSQFRESKYDSENPNQTITATVWINEYFIPVKEILSNGMSQGVQIVELQKLAGLLEKLLIAFKKWEAWKEGFILVFGDLNTSNENSFNALKEQVEYFQKIEIVSTLKFRPFN